MNHCCNSGCVFRHHAFVAGLCVYADYAGLCVYADYWFDHWFELLHTLFKICDAVLYHLECGLVGVNNNLVLLAHFVVVLLIVFVIMYMVHALFIPLAPFARWPFGWVVAFALQNSVLTVAPTESVVVVHYWVNWVKYLKKT